MSGIFGPPCWQPFAFFDPDSFSVRTCQATLLSDSTTSSVTLPRWGTACGGALYELPTPGLLTSGHGSSGLLGTPSAADAMGGHLSRGGNRSHELLLKGQVKALLPTPAVNDMGAGKTPEKWDAWTAEMQAKHGNGNGHGRSLSIETARLLPTPSASDNTGGNHETQRGGGPGLHGVGHLLPTTMSATYEQGGDGGELRAAIQHGPTRRLLPTPTGGDSASSRNSTANRKTIPPTGIHAGDTLTDAMTLLGASTNQQSDGGNTSPEPAHPHQLTIEDA